MKIDLMYPVVGRRKDNPQWYRKGNISAGQVVAAYQAKGAASLNASYTNLAHPGTNDLSPITAPNWSTGSGWIFDAGNQYLTTGLLPAAGYSAILRITSASSGTPLANHNGVSTGLFFYPTSGGNRVYANGDSSRLISGVVGSGTMAVAGLNCYLNGGGDGTIGGANVAAAYALYVGATNNAGTAANFFWGTLVAVAVYNIVLSASQVAKIHTALLAL
jgi:hypothetical protein